MTIRRPFPLLILMLPLLFPVSLSAQDSVHGETHSHAAILSEYEAIATHCRPGIRIEAFTHPSNPTAISPGLNLALSAADKLGKSGRFSIVEQPDSSILSGVETPTYTEGIDYVLSGEVLDYQLADTGVETLIRFKFWLKDANTNEVCLSGIAEGSLDLEQVIICPIITFPIDIAMNDLADQLAETFPERTRVIAVIDDYLVLNIGLASLVKEGAVFRIYRPHSVPNAAEEDMENTDWAMVSEVGEFVCLTPYTGEDIHVGDICICDEDYGVVYE
jgi:hypothetical protein